MREQDALPSEASITQLTGAATDRTRSCRPQNSYIMTEDFAKITEYERGHQTDVTQLSKIPLKRDNRYYLKRLRADHPGVHADYLAVQFTTQAEAFVAACIRKSKTALDQLKSTWSKATAAERGAFKLMIGCARPVITPTPSFPSTNGAATNAPPPSARSSTPPGVLHVGGYLVPAVVDQINAVIAQTRITTGVIMKEIGFDPLNTSLGLALSQGWRIKNPKLLIALEDWLAKNTAE